MDANQVDVRLSQIGLSDQEKQAVIAKIVVGSINPSGWNYVSDMNLDVNLRNLIQQGNKICTSSK
jgi:hypothetical protein